MRSVLLLLVIVRLGIDIVAFSFPGTLKKVQEMGWPINNFWIKTTMPVVVSLLLMGVLGLMGLVNTKSIEFLIPASIIPFSWVFVLLSYRGRTTMMLLDAVSWFLVGLFVVALFIF